jgi:hypothetical protein
VPFNLSRAVLSLALNNPFAEVVAISYVVLLSVIELVGNP